MPLLLPLLGHDATFHTTFVGAPDRFPAIPNDLARLRDEDLTLAATTRRCCTSGRRGKGVLGSHGLGDEQRGHAFLFEDDAGCAHHLRSADEELIEEQLGKINEGFTAHFDVWLIFGLFSLLQGEIATNMYL